MQSGGRIIAKATTLQTPEKLSKNSQQRVSVVKLNYACRWDYYYIYLESFALSFLWRVVWGNSDGTMILDESCAHLAHIKAIVLGEVEVTPRRSVKATAF